MADPQRTGLTGSPERRPREADSYFANQAPAGLARLTTSRPGFERQSTAPYRTQLASIRSPNSPGPVSPGAPRTPLFNRSFSSPFASPRAEFSASDEVFVLEFGSRYLRIGLGGERRPRCILDFGPSTQRRAGDYSGGLSGAAGSQNIKSVDQQSWGKDHELWQLDLRHVDLGLIKDKIERAVREAMAQQVLIVDDARKRTHLVAVPSNLPLPLLSVILEALFNHAPPPPTICLLTAPVLSLVAAGLRSGLVIDIGWRETTVTAVYEYREIKHARSTRAMKATHWTLTLLLKSHLSGDTLRTPEHLPRTEEEHVSMPISFEDSEDILYRFAWCRSHSPKDTLASQPPPDEPVEIFLPSSNNSTPPRIPLSSFSHPIETALFASDISDPQHTLDDDDLPLSLLAYRTLLALSLDVRHYLIPRIIVTGGGSNIPGLKQRLLGDIATLIDQRRWDPVHNYGSAEAKLPGRRTSSKQEGPRPVEKSVNKDIDPTSTAPPHLQAPLPDPILESIRSRAGPDNPSSSSATPAAVSTNATKVRGVETLGAWAGASLMAGLRIKGAVEIEREKFLQYGLLGPPERTESEEDSKRAKRQSVMPGQLSQQAKAGERSSGTWSLGVFG
ncbi:hypothetical protein FH972_023535 [Carpinus fangiana]|uniref:Actin-related protein 8 n=1 Tax=Carpinus fangiana TaxID=176857 RepID=A0A5N6KVY9_9ROSI|nr:hypothetical protein FH972_023535 [Carpinus fangiana]